MPQHGFKSFTIREEIVDRFQEFCIGRGISMSDALREKIESEMIQMDQIHTFAKKIKKIPKIVKIYTMPRMD